MSSFKMNNSDHFDQGIFRYIKISIIDIIDYRQFLKTF